MLASIVHLLLGRSRRDEELDPVLPDSYTHHSTTLVQCECGCGQSFPKDQMVKLGGINHPTELVYTLHYKQIWGE